MHSDRVNTIITLGPSTRDLDLRVLGAKGVDFVRNNMSHSSLEDLVLFLEQSREAGIPFILDTEGSQVRTGVFEDGGVHYHEGQRVVLHADDVTGDADRLCLTPGFVVGQLDVGDVLHVDFDALILLVTDTTSAEQGQVTARSINRGFVGNKKAVYLDRVSSRPVVLPTLSPKDLEAIDIALDGGVEHIAASFIRSGRAVEEVREATRGRMQIISKVECCEALEDLDAIIEQSDFLLLDRGDLSKEIPLEKIPFAQKIIIERARRQGTGVVVATNLLETMIEKRRPTRAEVNDIVNTIQDGAVGLTLAAETAVGKHPVECVNVLHKLLRQVEVVRPTHPEPEGAAGPHTEIVTTLEDARYLFDCERFSSLALPHGGRLVDRVLRHDPKPVELDAMPKVRLDESRQMDLRQIATGGYSPLEGFMGADDLAGVLRDMRLSNGCIWPLPIVLDVPRETADTCQVGRTLALVDQHDQPIGTLELAEKFELERDDFARRLYGTTDTSHPGVQMVRRMGPVLLGGRASWIPRSQDDAASAYNLTPRQVRKLFEERCWSTVVGFHTRNIPHRAHEWVQRQALVRGACDGLFVHPAVGKKKPGDFEARQLIVCHEHAIHEFFEDNQVVFGTFATSSRYAGPREAVFTALCRKNFGCSHFVVGRDHTGVGDFYSPYASHEIFDTLPDLGIEVLRFGSIYYDADRDDYADSLQSEPGPTAQDISGTRIRQLLIQGERPPAWLIRPEVADLVLEAIRSGDPVFVGD